MFRVFLPLKKSLVVTLSETCTLISRTNVAKKGMTIPKLSETLRLLYSKSKEEECDQRDLNISDQNHYSNDIPSGNETTTFTKTSHQKFFYR